MHEPVAMHTVGDKPKKLNGILPYFSICRLFSGGKKANFIIRFHLLSINHVKIAA